MNMRIFPISIALMVVSGSAMAQALEQSGTPPVAKRVSKPLTKFGFTLQDDYAWLRNKGSKDVTAYLQAENAYADRALKPLKSLENKLYREMISRLKESDTELPEFDKGYWYYTRTIKGKPYPLLCRRPGTMHAKEQVLLDRNALAKGKKFVGMGEWRVSDDGNLLAYSLDHTGFHDFEFFLKDLRTGKFVKEGIKLATEFEFARDNKTIFFTTDDEAKRPYRTWRWTVGQAKPSLVFEEKDGLFYHGISRTKDGKFLLLESGGSETSETSFINLANPKSAPKLIAKRSEGVRYEVSHRNGAFWIVTDDLGPNQRLAKVPVDAPARSNWQTVLPVSKDRVLNSVDLYDQAALVSLRQGGFLKLELWNLNSGKKIAIPVRDQVSTIYSAGRPDFHSKQFRYFVESETLPPSTYEIDLNGKSKLLKTMSVPGYQPSKYESKLIWITARDGVKVPVSMVMKKGLKVNSHTPILLEGYGAYGSPNDAGFGRQRLVLLDRGAIFATAYIRGGGEFGNAWHDDGKMMKKMNTFTDFIDVGRGLIAKGMTSRERLAITGASAGGLLMGAVLNLAPDLAGTALVYVPFVDLMNTMLDDTLPLTIGEYLEWGNPNEKAAFEYMLQYSPYDNIEAKDYPAIYCRTSLNDSQVMYFEPAKWVARLRANKTDSNPLIFQCRMDPGGHAGAADRYERYRDLAKDYAFLLDRWGIRQ